MDWATGFNTLASGLGSSAGPAMSSGYADGSTVNVGGLNVNNKPDLMPLVATGLVVGVLVWMLKR